MSIPGTRARSHPIRTTPGVENVCADVVITGDCGLCPILLATGDTHGQHRLERPPHLRSCFTAREAVHRCSQRECQLQPITQGRRLASPPGAVLRQRGQADPAQRNRKGLRVREGPLRHH